MTPAEFNPMDPVLENAVSQIHDEPIDPAVIEAAAARVWARLAESAPAADHIRNCADFQALIPDLRAGRLSEAKATLLRDHLHQCVECRRIYEGRVVSMPAARPVRRTYTFRWAAAAVVVAAAGVSVWFAIDQYGGRTGHAVVQSVNGTLYAVSSDGLRPLAAGQDLPDGVEFRTAKDSNALLELRDGSVVELRERSGFSTLQSSSDLTVRLNRGSIIVQAARRRNGSHLFVSTGDVRVAVTGTVFSVSAGVKGSRVSVIEGQVRVEENQQQKLLGPGQQSVTTGLDPLAIQEEISWSRNRERLVQQLDALRAGLQQIHLPALRYSSRLLSRLPADTTLYAAIPNLSDYLAQAQVVFRRQVNSSPELRAAISGSPADLDSLIGKLRAASEYLGEEIAVVSFGPKGVNRVPVLFAESRQDGFIEFLRKNIGSVPVVARGGLVFFGPDRAAVESLASAVENGKGAFQGTPFYARINETYRNGAGLLFCADLSALGAIGPALGGAHYLIAEQKEVAGHSELRANIGFDGPRTGVAGWLADAAPMGSLDYVSPDATVLGAFVVRNPAAIVDQVLSVQQRSVSAAEKALAGAQQQTGFDVRTDLAASLGGEFAIALDGPAFPVPSWKLIAEVYDAPRMQATLEKIVDAYNQGAPAGSKPLRTAREVVDGRTYYMIAGGEPNPLTEAHYTFVSGYMIAGPSRALVSRALQVKTNGTSITHAAAFLALQPKDRYANFSALVYQNLGTTLAPLAGLLSAFVPQGRGGMPPNAIQSLGNLKSTMIAAYGESDRITVAGSGDLFGGGLTSLVSGNLSGMLGNALPINRIMGTRAR